MGIPMGYDVIIKPLTAEEIKQRADEYNYITGIVPIDLAVIIDNDFEGFLDAISEALVGSELLMDTSYKVMGAEDGDIHIEVTGDVTEVLSFSEECK